MADDGRAWREQVRAEIARAFLDRGLGAFKPWLVFRILIRAKSGVDSLDEYDRGYLDRLFNRVDPLWVVERLLIGDGRKALDEENWIEHNAAYAAKLRIWRREMEWEDER